MPHEPTPEQLKRWHELDELESSCATSRPIMGKDPDQLVKEFFQQDYIESQLLKITEYREKLLKKLNFLQEYEDELLAEKAKRESKNE